jgi:hypothetical protein
MTDKDTLHICTKHASQFMHHGVECPWCAVLADAVEKMVKEYRRGFEDGVRAADADHAKRQQELSQMAVKLAMEAKNAKHSSDSKEPSKANTAVPADVPTK